MSDYHEFNDFTKSMRLLDMYLSDNGVKLPLLMVLEKKENCMIDPTVMDVSYESYSIHVQFPSRVLEIAYTGVKHSFNGIFNPRVVIGDMRIQLRVGSKGRILREQVVCSEAFQPHIDVRV